MTAATTAEQLPAFFVWIQTYGAYISFFGQMIWWLLTAIAALWAAWNFQRYVETRMGTLKAEGGVGSKSADSEVEAKSAKAEAADAKAEKAEKVDVDKFVE